MERIQCNGSLLATAKSSVQWLNFVFIPSPPKPIHRQFLDLRPNLWKIRKIENFTRPLPSFSIRFILGMTMIRIFILFLFFFFFGVCFVLTRSFNSVGRVYHCDWCTCVCMLRRRRIENAITKVSNGTSGQWRRRRRHQQMWCTQIENHCGLEMRQILKVNETQCSELVFFFFFSRLCFTFNIEMTKSNGVQCKHHQRQCDFSRRKPINFVPTNEENERQKMATANDLVAH